MAFCAHAILAPDLFVVGDTLDDGRFADNPLVTEDPNIRFYAGAPLVDPDGRGLGTLCVIDKVPRDLTREQTVALEALSRQVVSQLQLRRTLIEQRGWNVRLLAAKQDAEEANRTKSRFLAHMSHELRTPLNAIIGFANILRKKVALDERNTTLLERIAVNGKHLLALVNNVLDLSRIEAQKMEPTFETVDVSELVGDVATQIESLAHQGGNDMQVVTPTAPLEITTDRMLVRQCVLNLLSNACKFTENGTIRLAATLDTVDGQERLTLAVSDTGQGMSPQDVEGVFDEFYRAKRDLGHVEGTGLGLAITRKICRLLGGDVTVESRLHEGSTFTIRLPRSPEVEPPESTEADASDLVAACG